MRGFRLLAVALPILFTGLVRAAGDDPNPLSGVRRVVFLGDSITYAGQYIEFLETYLRLKDPTLRCEFLDLGLPSETVSGLSEPGHAGGKFPRPDLHERLDRVLCLLWDLARSEASELIASGAVRLGGRPEATRARRVATGQ